MHSSCRLCTHQVLPNTRLPFRLLWVKSFQQTKPQGETTSFFRLSQYTRTTWPRDPERGTLKRTRETTKGLKSFPVWSPPYRRQTGLTCHLWGIPKLPWWAGAAFSSGNTVISKVKLKKYISTRILLNTHFWILKHSCIGPKKELLLSIYMFTELGGKMLKMIIINSWFNYNGSSHA